MTGGEKWGKGNEERGERWTKGMRRERDGGTKGRGGIKGMIRRGGKEGKREREREGEGPQRLMHGPPGG
jgi:hypothetical protein